MTVTDPGFSIHRHVFRQAEMIAVLDAIDRTDVPRTKAGARHVLRIPEVRRLASDPALSTIARAYVGPDAFPFRATLFDKSSRSNWLVTWHQDTALPIQARCETPGWGPWSVKGGVLHAIAPASALDRVVALRVHLDDCTLENGPLRILPGTHTRGVLDHAAIASSLIADDAVDCVCDAGDVLAMRPLTLHASSKSRNDRPRRVLHIEFSGTDRFDGDVRLLRG